MYHTFDWLLCVKHSSFQKQGMVHGRAGYRNVWEWLGWSCDESQYASVVE